MGEGGDKQLIQQLLRTSLYRDYERAFSAATGMPLALRGVEHWQMALHGNEHENQDRDVSLQDFAKTVNTSTFYFCKLFTKATGLTFTDYLSRVRIEEGEEPALEPEPVDQRSRLRSRLPVIDALQPHVPQADRPVAVGLARGVAGCSLGDAA